ncbi:hypothetical protein [Pilimelia anulata]|uniref:hypothetical protein n=1 Tax=Pilimelia anulata TaxID=53371 RepID=UPI00166B351E|nr:hypothetical protein [Pilimelia anulata]
MGDPAAGDAGAHGPDDGAGEGAAGRSGRHAVAEAAPDAAYHRTPAQPAGPWAGLDGDDAWWHGGEPPPVPEPPAVAPAPRAGDADPGWRVPHRGRHGGPAAGRPRPARPPRSAAAGLAALVPLALLAAFFGWVAAGPFVLASGGGTTGTATITGCAGSSLGLRCTASFVAADGDFTADRVALLGVPETQRAAGTAVRARMPADDSRLAYAGDTLTLHLRWLAGALATLLCGVAIARATGVHRLPDPQHRRRARLTCLLGPLALLAAFTLTHW